MIRCSRARGGGSRPHTGSRQMRPPLPLTSDGWQFHEGGNRCGDGGGLRASGSGFLGVQNGSRCVRGPFWSAGAPDCLWRTEKARRGSPRRGAAPRAAGSLARSPPSGCTKWFSPRSRAVLERWCTRLPLAHRESASGARRLAAGGGAGSLRAESPSAASLVACPCVTKLSRLRTTSQSLTTIVVGYSLSLRPPPSSQTMMSSTRAP